MLLIHFFAACRLGYSLKALIFRIAMINAQKTKFFKIGGHPQPPGRDTPADFTLDLNMSYAIRFAEIQLDIKFILSYFIELCI